MRRLFSLLAVVLLGSLLRAAETGPYLDDPGRLLPVDTAWAGALAARLADLERTAGIKILVRLHAKSPSAEEDKVPGAYMRDLATKLGVIRHGVLVVYFADDPDWRIWIGDELASAFVGQAGTAREFTASGAMHEAKEALLKAALAQAETALTRQKSAAPQQVSPAGLKIVLQADALADGLIRRLGRR